MLRNRKSTGKKKDVKLKQTIECLKKRTFCGPEHYKLLAVTSTTAGAIQGKPKVGSISGCKIDFSGFHENGNLFWKKNSLVGSGRQQYFPGSTK